MKSAGYSGKPLISKLGYQPGQNVYLLKAPINFQQYLKSEGIKTAKTSADWAHLFFNSQTELEQFITTAKLSDYAKGLWVSWPKKSAKVKTDLTEQSFRDAILPLGWVDTKVCAIDKTWSGLKFVKRRS